KRIALDPEDEELTRRNGVRAQREQLFKEIRFCNNFRITLALSLIDFFGIDSWLDISAGWGDRLIASIVRGVRYVGVDPYVELHEGYKEIISTLAPKNMQHRYTMICDGFEND